MDKEVNTSDVDFMVVEEHPLIGDMEDEGSVIIKQVKSVEIQTELALVNLEQMT